MSATQVASRSLSGLGRRSFQCSRGSVVPSSASQRRTISSNSPRASPRAARLLCSSFSPRRSTSLLLQSSTYVSAARSFSFTPAVAHGDWSSPKPGEELYVTFLDKEGDEHKIAVSKGDNLLDIAQANDIEMEGACGGSCACSTCHVIVEDEKLYDLMSEPDDDENDMLDLAFGLTETSRLGCQVIMSKELDGLRVKLPSMTRNMQASDFSKKNERSD